MENIKHSSLFNCHKVLSACNFFDCTQYEQKEAVIQAKQFIGEYPGIRLLKQKSRHFITDKSDKNAVRIESILMNCLAGDGPANAYTLLMCLLNEAIENLKVTV